MNDLGVLIDRIKIAGFAITKGIIKQESRNTKNVLIIFQQIFGDSVVISGALAEYVKLFPSSKGYHIKMLVRSSVLDFMRSTLVIPNEIEYVPIDFTRLVNNYKYFKEIQTEYCANCYLAIVPGSSLSAELLSDVTVASKRIGLISEEARTWPPHMWLFQKLAYTDLVIPDKNEMMLQRHRRLLNCLGAINYKARLPELLEKKRLINHPYVVVCPGSSMALKCWPTERFAAISDHIIEKYNYEVHLCGGADEQEHEKAFLQASKHSDSIVSHVGKTNFSDWSAIVQHTSLVIGNDSATLHLAAAARVPAICIAGVYDKYQFFPYKVDKLEEGDRLPETVLVDMPCAWCRTKGYFAGYGNGKCKKQIKEGKCALCIDAVTVDMVKEKVDELLGGCK